MAEQEAEQLARVLSQAFAGAAPIPPDANDANDPSNLTAEISASSRLRAPPSRPRIQPTARPESSLGSGSPLPEPIRRRLEPALGFDLSSLRVHADAPAHRLAERYQARAFAFGSHLIFGRGEYAPDHARGQSLLAHEIVHVVQQSSVARDPWSSGSLSTQARPRGPPSRGTPLVSVQHCFASPRVQRMPGWDDVSNTFVAVGSAAVDTAVDVGSSAIGVAVDIGEGALEVGAEVVERTADFFISLIDDYAPGLLEFLRGGFMSRLTDLFCRGLDAVIGGLISSLEDIDFVSALEEAFSSAQGSVEGVIGAIRSGASSALGALMQPVVEALDEYGPGIIDAITGASDSVNGFFDSIWESIGAPAMDFLGEAGGAIWEEITGMIDWLWEATSGVREAAADAWDWVMEQFGIVWDSTSGIREWLAEKATEAWDAMKEALGPLEGPITVLLGVLLVLSPLGPIIIATQVIPPLWEKLVWLWNNWNTDDILVWAQDTLREDILPGIIGMVSGVASAIASAASWIAGVTVQVATAFGGVIGVFGGNACLATVTRVLNAVSAQFERLAAWAEGGFTGLAEAVSNVFHSIVAILQPILDFLVRLFLVVTNPPLLPIAIAGAVWLLIPDELKPPVINFVLDLIIAFLRGFPAFLTGLGPLASILKSGFLGFLEGLRAAEDQQKIDASNKVANLMAGAGLQFIAGFAVGILEGLIDGILDPFRLIWMLIQFLARLCRSIGDYLAPLLFEADPQLGAAVTGFNASVRATIPAHPPAHAPPAESAATDAAAATAPAPTGEIATLTRTTPGSMAGPTALAPPASGAITSTSATATATAATAASAPVPAGAAASPEDAIMGELMAAGPTASDADIVASLSPGLSGQLTGAAGELDAAGVEGESSAQSEVQSEGSSVGGLADLLGGVWTAILEGAHGLGGRAAGALLEFIMLPDYQLGNKIGYVAGLVLLEVIIAYFSGGVSVELKAAEPFIKAAIRFLDLGGEILGLLGRAVRPIKGPLLRGLSAAGEHLGRFRFLQPILQRIRRAADTLFHFGDEAADAASHAGGRADDVARRADDVAEGAGRRADDLADDAAGAGRRTDDAASAARKAAELPAAMAAAEAICEANDRIEPSPAPGLVHAQLNAALRPRFRWIEGFFSVPKGPGVFEIHMRASDHVIDRRYTTVRADVVEDVAESTDPRTHGVPNRAPSESPHIIGADEARIRVVHDLGVDHGRVAAVADGLQPNMPGTSRTWGNPYEFDGPFGHGIDDIMFDSHGVPVILEFKGGVSRLAEGQLSERWVRSKIRELRRVRDPMADILETALNNGTLTARVYRTHVDDLGNAVGTVLDGVPRRYGPAPPVTPVPVQPKLAVAPSSDAYEREADRVADLVTSATASAMPPRVSAYRPDVAARTDNRPFDRVAVDSSFEPAFERGLDISAATGRALSKSTRTHMESRFGVDFSHVRVHHDATSAGLSRRLGAHAFTAGRNIYFGSGQYRPGTASGDRLLAHELTHVVQQSAAISRAPSARGLSSGAPRIVQRQPAQPEQQIQSYVFAGDKRLATDVIFARRLGSEVAEKIRKNDGRLSPDERLEVQGMLNFFRGNAKDAYTAAIRTAVNDVANEIEMPAETIGIQSYVFAGNPVLATDLGFARKSGREMAARIRQSGGRPNRADQLEKEGMAKFFQGPARELYLDLVQSYSRPVEPRLAQLVRDMVSEVDRDSPRDKVLVALALAGLNLNAKQWALELAAIHHHKSGNYLLRYFEMAYDRGFWDYIFQTGMAKGHVAQLVITMLEREGIRVHELSLEWQLHLALIEERGRPMAVDLRKYPVHAWRTALGGVLAPFIQVINLALHLIPVFGQALGAFEAIIGQEVLTGRKLEGWERLLQIIPYAGTIVRAGSRGAKAILAIARSTGTKPDAVLALMARTSRAAGDMPELQQAQKLLAEGAQRTAQHEAAVKRVYGMLKPLEKEMDVAAAAGRTEARATQAGAAGTSGSRPPASGPANDLGAPGAGGGVPAVADPRAWRVSPRAANSNVPAPAGTSPSTPGVIDMAKWKARRGSAAKTGSKSGSGGGSTAASGGTGGGPIAGNTALKVSPAPVAPAPRAAPRPASAPVASASPRANPSPQATPQVSPTPAPAAQPASRPVAAAKPKPSAPAADPARPTPNVTPPVASGAAPSPASAPSATPAPAPVPNPAPSQQTSNNTCLGPTGLTPADPIPIRWFKPLYDANLYPSPITLGGRSYSIDDATRLPRGEPIGVAPIFRPRPGKIVQLFPEARSQGFDPDTGRFDSQTQRYRETLRSYGFDWGHRRYLQADHVMDLQWAPADYHDNRDQFRNMWPLDAPANTSAGNTQNNLQVVSFCETRRGPFRTISLREMKAEARANPLRRFFGRYFVITSIGL